MGFELRYALVCVARRHFEVCVVAGSMHGLTFVEMDVKCVCRCWMEGAGGIYAVGVVFAYVRFV